jgi:hypothetical protein
MAEKMTNVLGCGPFVGQLAFSVSDSKLMTTCTHKISQDELVIKKKRWGVRKLRKCEQKKSAYSHNATRPAVTMIIRHLFDVLHY